MAATAASVLKPDFNSQRKHFIFTDEHEQLRESIRNFAIKELAPHAEEWEETTFPDSVFPRMGELGFLGLDKPEAYGGQGGDYYSRAGARRGDRQRQLRRAGDGRGGADRHGDAADPRVRHRGAEARMGGTGDQGREDPVPGDHRARRRLGRVGDQDARGRDGDDYVINGSKTYITNGHRADVIVLVTKTDPDAGYDGFTLFLVPMDSPGVIREKRLEKLGMHASDTALLAFQDVRVPATAVLGQVGKGFYHIMWELQGERLIGAAGCVAGAQKCFEKNAPVRARAQGVRPRNRQVPGDPPQVRRDGHENRVRAPDGVRDRLALQQRRVPRARDLDGQAPRRARSPAKSPTSASRSTAARATCASTASSACGATCA